MLDLSCLRESFDNCPKQNGMLSQTGNALFKRPGLRTTAQEATRLTKADVAHASLIKPRGALTLGGLKRPRQMSVQETQRQSDDLALPTALARPTAQGLEPKTLKVSSPSTVPGDESAPVGSAEGGARGSNLALQGLQGSDPASNGETLSGTCATEEPEQSSEGSRVAAPGLLPPPQMKLPAATARHGQAGGVRFRLLPAVSATGVGECLARVKRLQVHACAEGGTSKAAHLRKVAGEAVSVVAGDLSRQEAKQAAVPTDVSGMVQKIKANYISAMQYAANE